jgi:hypothetical protein
MPLAYNMRAMFVARKLVNVGPDELTRNSHLWDVK